MSHKLKIGLFGLGHLGKIHLKCILLSNKYELVGAYDPNEQATEDARKEYNFKAYSSEDALIADCEVMDIVIPTSFHAPLARKGILAGKHLFIEKPVTKTVEEAQELLGLSEKHGSIVQVGHVERYNPAFLALKDMNFHPAFIEGHRLSFFNPRGTDVSVVHDLMIHDLDIVLSLMNSDPVDVSANGVAILSEQADICNARITFANGGIANLTASRMSLKNMRKLRLFQSDAYITMDFLKKQAEIIQLKEEAQINPDEIEKSYEIELPKGKKYIQVMQPEILPVNAIQLEIEDLADAILTKSIPSVSLRDGLRALDLAQQIHAKIVNHSIKIIE